MFSFFFIFLGGAGGGGKNCGLQVPTPFRFLILTIFVKAHQTAKALPSCLGARQICVQVFRMARTRRIFVKFFQFFGQKLRFTSVDTVSKSTKFVKAH